MKGIFRKLIGQLALVLLVLLVVGVGVSWVTQKQQGLVAMFCALAACTFSVVTCLIPVGFAVEKQSSWFAQACLAATLIRFFLTILSAALLYFLFTPLKMPFAVWLIIDYLVLLIWETLVLVKQINMYYQKPCSKTNGTTVIDNPTT